jgi:pyridinium-3,5-bisthiocarboxylic acid mononucleotide nickel chelatase
MAYDLLYLDPWSGLSGDMTLAALVDAGGPEAEAALHAAVASMALPGVSVEVVRDTEWGIRCTKVNVRAEQSPPLRHLTEMLAVVDGAALPVRVRERSRAALVRLAEVEAGIHGCSMEEIHFHEVGAADTLVDVVGTFVLAEALGVKEVFVGTIPLGGGEVQIAHGRMGVPAPATAELLIGYRVVGGPEMRELTTPTGALLVVGLGARQGPLPAMVVEAVGYGAGMMTLERGPNVLRVVLGHAEAGGPDETVVELQTNLDDVSGEVIGYTLRRLREAGALDAWTVPAQMKKDRPGVVLHALVTPGLESDAVAILLAETGTLGVRRSVLGRHVAERGSLAVTVDGQQVSVKWGRWQGRLVSLAPEYEDAAAAAAALGVSLGEVMRRAVVEALRLVGEDVQT